MKSIVLALALAASLPALAQEPQVSTGEGRTAGAHANPQWWQEKSYAQPVAQDHVPAAGLPQSKDPDSWRQAPNWLDGQYGWKSAQGSDMQRASTDLFTQTAMPQVFQVAASSWGSRARDALDEMRASDMDSAKMDRWETSILASEQRLIQRLVKAQAQGQPYVIWVNLPAFRLRVLDPRDGAILLESRVIVGKTSRPTPRMDTNVINLKFNPDWSPPKSSPGSKWTAPGPHNPLGRVRFSTDNGRGIYLHDTNHHELFDNPVRAFSLGCIRVQEWNALAMLLSGKGQAWVDSKAVDWKTRWEDIADVPVFLDYQRVDFDDAGMLVEHADLYRLGQRAP
jgi:murein L,D-transpeptidase YcbB/YkuD